MSNVHRFRPKPKAPPPRRRLAWGSAAWVPWVLVLLAAAVLTLVNAGDFGTPLAVVAIVLLGAWLGQRS